MKYRSLAVILCCLFLGCSEDSPVNTGPQYSVEFMMYLGCEKPDNVEITIDKKTAGTTLPLTVKLSPGDHDLQIHATGMTPILETLTVTKDRNYIIYCE